MPRHWEDGPTVNGRLEIAQVRRPAPLRLNHASEGEAEDRMNCLLKSHRVASAYARPSFRPFTSSSLQRSVRDAVLTAIVVMSAGAAHAVVVRGRITDALGKPLAGGRVQLVYQGHVVGVAYGDPEGLYEVRIAEAGRFTLLGSASGYLPFVGQDFYGRALDVVNRDVVLATNSVRQEVSVTATGLPTPLPRLTSPVSVLPGEAFATRAGVVDEMRQTPGAFLVQSGQTGSVTSLFMRGGNSTANLVLIDGVPAEDIGGTFDWGTVSSTAVSHMELYRGPDSAIYGTDAGAAVVIIDTPRGTTLKPVLTYSGDAGNLHTWRNEVTLGGTLTKLDYFGAFSRFDTSNALPGDRYHSGTAALNLGYHLTANTSLRFTVRNADSVIGVPGAFDFQGVSEHTRQADQDLYSAGTFEDTRESGWHNLLRYGIARKREQAQEFDAVGNLITFDPGTPYSYTGYVGNTVTIRGANGTTATGQVQLFNGNNDDLSSLRDQLYFQSDYAFNPHVLALFGFRYDNERGSFNDYLPAYAYESHEQVQRTNFEYNLQFQGEFYDRLFYTAGGAIEKNHLYGIAGTPKIGLAYVPVRQSAVPFHGTRLRANVALGVQEPTLALEYQSLYKQLQQNGDTAAIQNYRITPQAAERSRTYDLGVDQNILGDTLVLHAGYFHNVFDRQLESVSAAALRTFFGFPVPSNDNIYSAYLNSLAYRAQGAEMQLTWQPKRRLLFRGGYTYLATRVLQSFSSDALAANQGIAFLNPAFPTTPIGASGPLAGARVFRRAPNTGYASAQYTRPRFSLVLQAAMASRSDDSTFLLGEDADSGNSLLLPNRDLDYGYVKLDLGGTFALPHRAQLFAQLNNLLNDQHIGPIGYPGLPFTFRTGVKVRLGGD